MDPHVATLSLRLPSRPAYRVRPEPSHPRLSVIVVNYQHWLDTAHLVRQLRTSTCSRQGSAEIVVVDNHSPVDRVARRLRRLPGVSLRRFGSNRGFAKAVNEGWRLSRGEWLLLLNPDVTLPPGFLDEALALCDRMSREQPRLGIIGLQLRNADGSQQYSAGPFPTLPGTLARLLLPRSRRKYYANLTHRREAVDWVTGCCLLVRRECLKQLSGFDRDFFLYYEDVDLCRRASQQGWAVTFEPGLSVVHHYPLHSRRVPSHLRLITRHALLTYARKHWSAWQFQVLGQVVRLEAWCRHLWARLRGDAETAAHFDELGKITAAMLQGDKTMASRRLHRVVRRHEQRLGRVPVPCAAGAPSS
jgi:N-acetylglucosaminyl-diphospho-decaprenol L-rhamnosyltransferase